MKTKLVNAFIYVSREPTTISVIKNVNQFVNKVIIFII